MTRNRETEELLTTQYVEMLTCRWLLMWNDLICAQSSMFVCFLMIIITFNPYRLLFFIYITVYESVTEVIFIYTCISNEELRDPVFYWQGSINLSILFTLYMSCCIVSLYKVLKLNYLSKHWFFLEMV